MQKFFLSRTGSALAVSAAMALGCTGAMAATRDVPTQYPHIQDAIGAAASGDEIRVANNFVENESFVTLSGKSLTIRSYTPNFSAPAPGAKWESVALADVNAALLTISNASLTIEGFESLSGDDCNVFYLESDVNLSIIDSVLTGTGRADTAGIKNATGARNLAINIEGTSITDNGRGIWLNRIGGTTSLNISDSVVSGNTSYPIAWESVDGTHTVNVTDTYLDTRNIRMTRFFGFRAPAGTLTTNDINFERCHFYATSDQGRYPLSIAGVDDAHDPNSTMTVSLRNCLFDLTDGEDNLETVAVNSQDDTATRRSEIVMEHCTVVFNGVNKCGIRLRENQSTLIASNCIFDAGGEGKVAFRSLRGKTISNKNLLNATAVSEVFAGGSVELSGTEIVGESAQFADGPAGDFRLGESSPAIGVGQDLGITVDMVGNPRPTPAGSLPDLGAYEYIVTASVPDWAIY